MIPCFLGCSALYMLFPARRLRLRRVCATGDDLCVPTLHSSPHATRLQAASHSDFGRFCQVRVLNPRVLRPMLSVFDARSQGKAYNAYVSTGIRRHTSAYVGSDCSFIAASTVRGHPHTARSAARVPLARERPRLGLRTSLYAGGQRSFARCRRIGLKAGAPL